MLVAAAGNTEDTRVAYPARAKHVIAVGATTEHGCLADYSNTGSGLDLVAPGGGADAVDRRRPELPARSRSPGRDIFQFTFRGTSPRRFGLPRGYEGTSMAVPHVSGTAALVHRRAACSATDPSPEAIAAAARADRARPRPARATTRTTATACSTPAAATAPLP